MAGRGCRAPEPGTLSPAALHNGHFAPAAPSECMWAMWDTGKMVSMATRTSEMPVRKFALGENILLQLTLQRKDRGGLQQHPRNGGVKISRVVLVVQCSVHSLPGLAAPFAPCSDKATPSHCLKRVVFLQKGPSGRSEEQCAALATSPLWPWNGTDAVQKWNSVSFCHGAGLPSRCWPLAAVLPFP